MSTDPEPLPETDELRTRLARLETHAAAMDAHVLDFRQLEHRRAWFGLLLALGGLLISLFLPWTDENGVYYLSGFLSGTPDHAPAGFTAAGIGAMLIVTVAALPFLSRPGARAAVTGFAALVASASLVLFLQVVLAPRADFFGEGVLVAFVSAIAAPVCASRVARLRVGDTENDGVRGG